MRLLKRKTAPLDRRESLAGVPVLNNGVELLGEAGENLMLSVKVFRGRGFLDRFRPEEMTRKIRLDELGSFVVRQINGKRDVLKIIDAFVGKYKTNRREAELSVVAFLKSLVQRNVISIAIK